MTERFAPAPLLDLMRRALERSGATPAMASATAAALVAAELDGIPSHGASRIPQYCVHVANGRSTGSAAPRVARERGGACLVDAGGGLAFEACALGVREAIGRARAHGVAFVSIANSNHFGVAAFHVEPIAEAGLVGLAFGNSPAAMPMWGSKRALFGTNPIPADGAHVVTTCAGYPSLEDTDRREGGHVTFGYLVAGFQAVGLMPRELVAIQDFLGDHVGHRIESPLATGVNNGPGAKQVSYAGVPHWQRPTRASFLETTCDFRMYYVMCGRDSGVFDSKARHSIRALREMTLSCANVDLYVTRVVRHLDTDLRGFHPFRRNFLRMLGSYLQKHRMHEPNLYTTSFKNPFDCGSYRVNFCAGRCSRTRVEVRPLMLSGQPWL